MAIRSQLAWLVSHIKLQCWGWKMTGGLVLLDGLSVATTKNDEIRDILIQINIESGCYNSVQSPKLQLANGTSASKALTTAPMAWRSLHPL